jgi:hypothetical protein
MVADARYADYKGAMQTGAMIIQQWWKSPARGFVMTRYRLITISLVADLNDREKILSLQINEGENPKRFNSLKWGKLKTQAIK